MYDCVTGVQIPDNYGCIMADEMVRSYFIYLNENKQEKIFPDLPSYLWPRVTGHTLKMYNFMVQSQ